MEADPSTAENDGGDTHDLFTAFFKPLQQASVASRNAKDSDVDYLDSEAGIALQWANAVSRHLEDLANDEAASPEEQASYHQEANTWLLLQGLYLHRTQFVPPDTPSTSAAAGRAFKYTPPLSVIQQAIAQNGSLSELSIIRDWLHTIAYPSLQPAEIRRGYLPYTKNQLKQALRTNPEALNNDKLVRELDPDASNRTVAQGKRRAIDSEDANYERALLRSLFEYVRVGELDQAMDMARQSDCPWRAASLAGGKLFEDAVLSNAARLDHTGGSGGPGDDGMDVQSTHEVEDSFIQGNLRRKLWKKSCRAIARSAHLDVYEKALYGAVTGDEESVLAVARTWEDYLWTRINTLIEVQIDTILEKAEDNFFQTSAAGQQDAQDLSDVEKQIAKKAIPESLQTIFNGLLAEQKLHNDARSPFHVAQSWVILNRISDLLESFASKLEQSNNELDEPQLAQLLRFFSHLILFYRLIAPTSAEPLPPLPEDASASIIEGYIDVLQAHEQSPAFIAFYCTALETEHAVDVYSRYLHQQFTTRTLEGPTDERTDRMHRHQALAAAANNHLDMPSIARRVTEVTVEGISTELPDFSAAKASFGMNALVSSSQASEKEVDLIRSVEWLTFDPTTYPEALVHANALIRYFLCAGSPSLASRVLAQVPSALLATSEGGQSTTGVSSTQIDEYLDHTSFFDALRLHLQFTEVWSRRPASDQVSQSEQMRFAQSLEKLTDELWSTFVELLTSEWLVVDINESHEEMLFLNAERRRLELKRIRCAYLPELVFRLHSALVLSGEEFVPRNIGRALELATIVADERYRIYLEFLDNGIASAVQENRLPTYLSMVKDANLLRLKHEGSPKQT